MQTSGSRRAGTLAVILSGVAALAAFALAPGSALAASTVTADGVTASVAPNRQPLTQTLTIEAAATPRFSVKLPCAAVGCDPSLQATRISPGPRPDVILEDFAEGGGGAVVLDDFSWSVARDTWLDSHAEYPILQGVPPTLEALGGGDSGWVTHAVLPGLTFAESGQGPIVIQRPVAGSFVDVERQFPAAIKRDAAQWLSQVGSGPGVPVGPLAAWAADESLLGNGARAAAYIHSLNGSIEGNPGLISAATVIADLAADGYPLRAG